MNRHGQQARGYELAGGYKNIQLTPIRLFIDL